MLYATPITSVHLQSSLYAWRRRSIEACTFRFRELDSVGLYSLASLRTYSGAGNDITTVRRTCRD